MRKFALLLAVASAGWLVYAMTWFLGEPFPGRGFVISVPYQGEFRYEHGVLHQVTGGVRMVDFGPWWSVSLGAAIAVLLLLALRGALAGRGRARGT